MAGTCERGSESYDSIKGGEFLGQVSDYQRLKKPVLRGAGLQLNTE